MAVVSISGAKAQHTQKPGSLPVRKSEWLLAGYFAYTGALACILPVRPGIAPLTVILNLSILAVLALAIHAWSLRGSLLIDVERDWFALLLTLLAYREMGWFAAPHTSFTLENLFIRYDHALLRDWGLHGVVECLGPVLPGLLEICYMLTYALAPFAVAMLYVYRRRERVDSFLFPFLLSVLLCYVQFPFWPSEPPRTVFPGEDFPSVLTVFRRFNWWMLGGYGIHTSVFPSAHVAGAFGTAFSALATLPEHRWVGRVLLAIAVLIAVATVYGRYHYAADAAAGFAMSLIGFGLGRRLLLIRAGRGSRGGLG
jgi:membrane-associated phospholipid phosphatase